MESLREAMEFNGAVSSDVSLRLSVPGDEAIQIIH